MNFDLEAKIKETKCKVLEMIEEELDECHEFEMDH